MKLYAVLLTLLILQVPPWPPVTNPLCEDRYNARITINDSQRVVSAGGDYIICQFAAWVDGDYLIFDADGEQAGYDISGLYTHKLSITRTGEVYPDPYAWVATIKPERLFLPMVSQ